MLKNYLKVAVRNFVKNGSTSIINFIGLTIGMVSCILIFLYVKTEISYDMFHKNSQNIYKVLTIDEALGVSNNLVGITLPPIGNSMVDEIPEVIDQVRISSRGRSLIKYEDYSLFSKDLIYTDNSLFNVFDFKLKLGDVKTALSIPNTCVLTETMATNIFGDIDPIGKTISADGTEAIEVVGIMENVDEPSHLKFDVILSINPSPSDTLTANFLNSWRSIAMLTYVQVIENSSQSAIESKMEELIRKNGVSENFKVKLQPLNKVHLESTEIIFDELNQEKGDRGYVNILVFVAIIIILIASFNFMNLATAYSSNRSKEVGMRKAVGALRRQVMLQNLGESIMQCLLAFVVSMGIVEVINSINPIIDVSIFTFIFSHFTDFLIMIVLAVLIGFISGSYPAIILSGFKPHLVLKGIFKSGGEGIFIRRILVILQFAASIIMICGTLVIFNQLNFIKTKDKGFDSEDIINIKLNDLSVLQTFEAFKNELITIPSITNIATSGGMPGEGYARRGALPEGAAEDDIWIVSVEAIDENYIPLLGMELIEGENFSEDRISEENRVIIVNESFVKANAWEEPIGKKITAGPREFEIIGVIKDFHFTSMKHKIEPIVMIYRPGSNGTISLKIDPVDIQGTIEKIEKTWDTVNPMIPFEYTYFEDEFAKLEQKENDFGRLIIKFTLLSIFIAALGLFGLAAYSVERKNKEIGIRKVLGSSVTKIILNLSNEFTKLVGISIIIAVPCAYYLLNNWLQNFEYKVGLNVSVFLISAVIALLIAFLT
ncbi:ABC transporter permease, partial [Bacteroidota bacterium]